MKKSQFLLSVLCAATVITGCSKSKEAFENKLPNPGSSLSMRPEMRIPGDGVWDVLGYGYDVTGEYANPNAVRYMIVDATALKAAESNRVISDPSQFSYGKLTAGSNVEEYTKGLSANTTATFGFSVFGATIKASYADSTAFSSKYAYASYDHILQKKALKFSADNQLLMNYLSPAFVTDIANNSAENIVKRYGTHVLSNIVLGAKLQILYRMETTSKDREKAVRAGIDMPLKGVFGISANINSNQTDKQQNFSETFQYQTVGGNSSIPLIGSINLPSPGQQNPTYQTIPITEWTNSVTSENAQLIDLKSNGLIPIYELISDPGKKMAVKNYIDQYIANNKVSAKPDNIHVYYNSQQSSHAFSTFEDPYLTSHGFQYLGVNFKAFISQVPGTLPIHHFYHPTLHIRIYTIDRFSWPFEANGYIYDGVKFYAYPSQQPNTYGVHTFWNSTISNYTYTINRYDWPYEQNGYTYMGINFYAFKP